jgi:hypothetical protein
MPPTPTPKGHGTKRHPLRVFQSAPGKPTSCKTQCKCVIQHAHRCQHLPYLDRTSDSECPRMLSAGKMLSSDGPVLLNFGLRMPSGARVPSVCHQPWTASVTARWCQHARWCQKLLRFDATLDPECNCLGTTCNCGPGM